MDFTPTNHLVGGPDEERGHDGDSTSGRPSYGSELPQPMQAPGQTYGSAVYSYYDAPTPRQQQFGYPAPPRTPRSLYEPPRSVYEPSMSVYEPSMMQTQQVPASVPASLLPGRPPAAYTPAPPQPVSFPAEGQVQVVRKVSMSRATASTVVRNGSGRKTAETTPELPITEPTEPQIAEPAQPQTAEPAQPQTAEPAQPKAAERKSVRPASSASLYEEEDAYGGVLRVVNE
ncbi:hypothetical protein BV25DRAFT_64040 [Artomyces pyxidatus]|uniref:Uncharacterized protein n=1 Tax=Artomyces pyxidatus TaxID=48021 RepID=A0ACB8TKJ7_9AGAM|nr:hypothetical protein BV25DRAFT_64040 [Artomyces pyxidatus]